MSKIISFSANNQGVDYICSDIHGYFPLLEARMREVNFDPRKDRVFSLGDLIDRGDESHRALEFLQYPWFHAILGNHELMLMRAYESDDPQVYEWWYYWGGEWAKSLSQAQMQAYYDAFKYLPVAIELSLRNGLKVGLVHAQLPSPVSWHNIYDQLSRIPQQVIEPDSYDVVKAGASGNDIAEMLWSKSQAYASKKERTKIQPVQDIDHVFHGHSIVYRQPDTIANRTFMDLGSYETGEIGFIDPVEFLKRVSQ
jgi:serine/threonine protein phosphatase 1